MTRFVLSLIALISLAVPCSAAFVAYSSSPSTNSLDFAAGVASYGQAVATLTFNDHPVAALDPNFYAGVHINVVSGATPTVYAGAAGAGSPTAPNSSGEGPSDLSNHLFPGTPGYTMTITFDTPVLAAGFFVLDLYNPGGVNSAPFQAFDGPNGTGALLGSFFPEPYNFQADFRYFMGALSSDANIRSIVYSSNGVAGDGVYIEDIQYSTSATPEPGTWTMLLGAGVLIVAGKRLHTRPQISGR